MEPTMNITILVMFCLGLRYSLSVQPCQTPNGDFGDCKSLYECSSLGVHYDHIFVSPEIQEYTKRSHCGYNNEEPKVCCHTRQQVSAKNKTAKHPFVTSDLLPTTNCGLGTSNETYPWLALLFYKNDVGRHHGCGGVLINERYVLTAAHCATSNLLSVRLGKWNNDTNSDCENGKRMEVSIEEKNIFQGYVSNEDVSRSYNDIALLRLRQKVNFTRFIQPICLPTTVDELFNDYMHQKLVTAGKTKLKLEADVTNCWFPTYDAGQICTDGEAVRDSCDGGPLMATKSDENGNSRTYAVGVVSFGGGVCGQKRKPAVHSKVAKYLYWIVDNIEA